MQPHDVVTAVAALVAGCLLVGGCGGDGDAATPSGAALPQGDELVTLDPSTFTTDIDNRFWPMRVGTRWTYRELDENGASSQVRVTVTSTTRRIANGVTARVVRDTVAEDGGVVEDTFDWYAQDADGNVWYLGEDTAEFEDGEVTSRAGSWEAGVEGALAGVIMPARPVDDLRYRQEYAKDRAEDTGEVLSVEEQAQVPAGHYDGAVLTKDTNGLEPRALEYKLYAPRVGPVLTLDVSGSAGREELVRVERVGADAARAAGAAPLGHRYP
jgi:hypothetical protein